MMDSQENPSLEEITNENDTPQLEQGAAAPTETTEAGEAAAAPAADEPAAPEKALPQTQQEVVDRLKQIQESGEIAERQELETLKQVFYKIHKNEVNAARTQFVAEGGDPATFIPQPNTLEEEFKAAMNVVKQRRAELMAKQEQEKEENLQKKLQILERIKQMSATPEEANQAYKEFKDLQAQWQEAKAVPAERAAELWKTYQLYVEQYYDQLKLNNEFREYDFKKNLEIKTRLCEAAEKLGEEKDVIAAFQQLQNLHQEYKETGPVAKELREEIWNRFKAASTLINKRHQQFFEERKAKEEENLKLKTALCEKVEDIRTADLKTVADWDGVTATIIEIQKEWRAIGFAPQKMNVRIFERFRAACDIFFNAKAEFFRQLKENQADNLKKKTVLCEKAEALKDSTDWKATADELMNIQKEWKTIGAVPKKHSEALWQRFIGACDYFFEQKNKATSSQRSEEKENLAKKQDVIARLKALLDDTAAEEGRQEAVRELMNEWNSIGFVPFRDKDKLYKAYHEVVDQLFKALNMSANRRRLDQFKSNLKNEVSEGGQTLSRERDRLMRAYEAKKNEIMTYENNLGFLTCSSKKGSSLLNEMNKKVEKLKEELQLIADKIAAVNKEINNQ